ncbi:MAG: hypothetical protein V3S10_04130, partial [Dehalococcoidales bacterium]
MSRREVNPSRKYFDFQGGIPPIALESVAAEAPPEGPRTHPKMITDTTMRDGAQDPSFAILPNETKLAYFDLLHKLDNGTGTIDAV